MGLLVYIPPEEFVFVVVLFLSLLWPMGFNAVGCQSNLLQRCHPTCRDEGSSHLSPVLASRFFIAMQVFSTLTTRQPRVEFYILTCSRFSLRKPGYIAANWLPSRLGLSVETRRQVWLAEDGVFRCAPLPSPNLVAFGRVAARERQGALSRRAW